MTTTFNIKIHETFKTSTRPNGAFARQYILRQFREFDRVNLDFFNENPTPSFVDECIGQLISDLGWDEFKQRIQISNPSVTARSLIKVVISRRKAQASESIHA